MIMRDGLIEAAKDLRFLLSRGYNRVGAAHFVGDKNRLTLEEKHILMRAAYDEAEAEKRKKKLVKIDEITGETISIDGYNLLITVESMLANKTLIRCDDYVTRDVSAVFGKHKITTKTTEALRLILEKLKEYNPKEIRFSYDKQVSKSGELAAKTREIMAELELAGRATTDKKSDISALGSGNIVASSDSVIIQKAKRILDLAGELATQASYQNIIQLPS